MESDWHTRGWTQLLKSSHAIMKRVVHDSGVKLGYHNVVNRRAMTLSPKRRLSQPIIEVEDVPRSRFPTDSRWHRGFAAGCGWGCVHC